MKLAELFYVVDTDNFGGDYPDEKFLGAFDSHTTDSDKAWGFGTEAEATAVANYKNGRTAYRKRLDEHASRFYKVVKAGYKLQPGFEP